MTDIDAVTAFCRIRRHSVGARDGIALPVSAAPAIRKVDFLRKVADIIFMFFLCCDTDSVIFTPCCIKQFFCQIFGFVSKSGKAAGFGF